MWRMKENTKLEIKYIWCQNTYVLANTNKTGTFFFFKDFSCQFMPYNAIRNEDHISKKQMQTRAHAFRLLRWMNKAVKK